MGSVFDRTGYVWKQKKCELHSGGRRGYLVDEREQSVVGLVYALVVYPTDIHHCSLGACVHPDAEMKRNSNHN